MKNEYTALYNFFQSLGDLGTDLMAQCAPLLLVVAVQIVPLLMSLVIKQEENLAGQIAELSFARKYYIFLALNVFLFYAAGSAYLTICKK